MNDLRRESMAISKREMALIAVNYAEHAKEHDPRQKEEHVALVQLRVPPAATIPVDQES